MSNGVSSKAVLTHLRAGTVGGISTGFILAFFESVYLLFSIGNFLVDLPFFLKAVLIYGLAGGVLGFLASAVFYLLFFRKTVWAESRTVAFYASFFMGAGIFGELFLYLMDIYPFGGPNKWSLKTLSLVAAALLVSFIVVLGVNYLLRVIFTGSPFKLFSRRVKIYRELLLFIVFLVCFSIFMALKGVDFELEKNVIASKSKAVKQDETNLIIILVDALRPDHLSCHGYFLPTSPNIDTLTANGFSFRSALATSTWSIPTHASLFTGLYPSSHGAYSLFSVLGEEVPTMAEVLSKNGYYTLSLYDNPLLGKISGLDRGFDVALGVENEQKVSLTLIRIYKKFLKKESLTDDIFRLTCRWIDHCAELNLPYFVFMNLFDVHAPYSPKEPYFSEFLKSARIDQVNIPLVRRFTYQIKSMREKLDLLAELSDADLSYLLRMYDSNIRYEDEQIGELIGTLEGKNQLGNTLIIVTADHGEFLGEHQYIGHLVNRLYNPGLRIPLVFWLPEKMEPEVEDAPVSQVDIFPTVLSLLGLEDQTPAGIQGVDLFSDEKPQYVLAEFFDDVKNKFSRAIVSPGRKLIVNVDGGLELYDLDKDPGENDNLAATHPEKAAELRDTIKRKVASFERFEPRIEKKGKRELKRVLRSLSYLK